MPNMLGTNGLADKVPENSAENAHHNFQEPKKTPSNCQLSNQQSKTKRYAKYNEIKTDELIIGIQFLIKTMTIY